MNVFPLFSSLRARATANTKLFLQKSFISPSALRLLTKRSLLGSIRPFGAMKKLQESSNLHKKCRELSKRHFASGFGGQTRYNFKFEPIHVIYGIIAANILVFLLWQYANQNAVHLQDYSLLNFMYKNYTLGLHSSPVSWILANFSHNNFMHLAINMYVLYGFGQTLILYFGITKFITLYSLSGLFCSATSMFFKNQDYQATMNRNQPVSLGASGCTSGLLTVFALLFPFSTIHFIIIPMPAFVAIGGFALYDLYNTLGRRGGRIDAAGHVGGGLGGVLYYLSMLRR